MLHLRRPLFSISGLLRGRGRPLSSSSSLVPPALALEEENAVPLPPKDFSLDVIDPKAHKFLMDSAKKENDDAPIDWIRAMDSIRTAETQFPMASLSDEERETLVAHTTTHNLAKIVNDCPALKGLLDLGVELYRWEDEGLNDLALRLDWERDVHPKTQYLREEVGLNEATVAEIFSLNPKLLIEDLDVLKPRVDYLRSKNFTPRMIQELLAGDPWWLDTKIPEIDARLGFLQKRFALSGKELRAVAAKCPRLVTWVGLARQFDINKLAIQEFMGFSKEESRALFLLCPQLYKERCEERTVAVFNYLHNDIGFPHELLAKHPEVLLARMGVVQFRHAYLKRHGRDQYRTDKPNYVSPMAIMLTEDDEFAEFVAKTSLDDYYHFLMTL